MGRKESNLTSDAYKASALPLSYTPMFFCICICCCICIIYSFLVLPGGIEPSVSGLKGQRPSPLDDGSICDSGGIRTHDYQRERLMSLATRRRNHVGRGGLEPPAFLMSQIYSLLPSPNLATYPLDAPTGLEPAYRGFASHCLSILATVRLRPGRLLSCISLVLSRGFN